MIDAITGYDRANFVTYARILNAVRHKQPWDEAAAEILGLEVSNDPAGAYSMWRAHVDRAEWIVGDGLVLIAQNHPVPDRVTH
jgi:hypothetical protein